VLDAHRKRLDVGHDLALSGGVESQDFIRAPIRDPESAVAPARGLAKQQPIRDEARTIVRFGNYLHGDLLDPCLSYE
jgi:hypothetical protein